MDETLRRLAPLTGIGAVVLLVAGMIIAAKGSPGFAGPAEEIADYYVDETGRILAATVLFAIAAPFFVWFLGCLRTGIARVEGGATRLASTAFGAGIAALALLLAALMINAMGALRADEDGQIALEAATVFFDTTNVLFGAAAPAAFAATLIATAVASLRHKAVLPGWLAVATIVLGVVNVIPPIAWVGMLISLLWIAIVSGLLYAQRVTVEPVVRA